MKIRFVAPFPVGEEGLSRRRAQIPDAVIAPGMELEFVAARNSGKLGDSPYEAMLMEMYVFEAGMRAEVQGCDAVVMDTVSDSGLDALRSRLTIPVVGPGAVGYHVAAMLGRRFSVVSIWEGWDYVYRRTLAKYEVGHLAASVRSLDKVPDIDRLLEGEDEVLEDLRKLSLRCVNEDGADVIVLGSTTMHAAAGYLAAELPVPVISPGLWAYKMAETLVQLRMTHSRRAYPSPEVLQDELWAALPSADAGNARS
jgi:allantoin racemase